MKKEIFFLLCLMLSNICTLTAENKNQKLLKNLTKVNDSETVFNVANWIYWQQSNGQSMKDSKEHFGGYFPGPAIQTIFQDGLVWGGKIEQSSDKIRVGGQTYKAGTQSGNWEEVEASKRIYRIRPDWKNLTKAELIEEVVILLNKSRSYINGFPFSIDEEITREEIESVADNYEADWKEWPVDLGAPYVDVDENGFYNPVLDSAGLPQISLGDYPGIEGSIMTIWYVNNDKDANLTRDLYGSDPLGLEVQTTLWTYASSNYSDLIFKRYIMINKSESDIDSMYISKWADIDNGNAGDDLASWDAPTQTGYIYNDHIDSHFGDKPPAIGYKLLIGPHINTTNVQDTAIINFQKVSGFKNLAPTSFSFFNNNSDQPYCDPEYSFYTGTQQWYNLMRGFTPTTDLDNPTPFLVGNGSNKGQETKFCVSGNPIAGVGDIDGQGDNPSASDRRFQTACGPFNLASGDIQEFIWVLGGGQGNSNLNSVEALLNTMAIDSSALLVKDRPFVEPVEFEVSHPVGHLVKIEMSVRTENIPDITRCTVEAELNYFELDDAPAHSVYLGELNEFYLMELFDNGRYGDQAAGDNIWTNSIDNLLTFDYPVNINVVIYQGDKRTTFSLLKKVSLRPTPEVRNFRIVWENGYQDNLLNHLETVHIGMNITNLDENNDIANVEILDDPHGIFNVNLPVGETLTDGSVFLTIQAPAIGDSVLVDFSLLFDNNLADYSFMLPLVEKTFSTSWRDTLEAENLVRSNVCNVVPLICDEFELTGHSYEITFNNNSHSELTWNLYDLTTNTLVLENQQLFPTPNLDYPIVDGIEWKVYNPDNGINAIQEEDQEGNILAPAISPLNILGSTHTDYGTTGYLITNRAGILHSTITSNRDFDRFNFWNCDDIEINFGENSLTWDYFSEEVHFEKTSYTPFYAPFSVYRHKTETGERQRLFVGFWDDDGSGTWNIPHTNGGPDWETPILKLPSYEPVYCWVGYDPTGNEISYDPANDATYVADNMLSASTTANTSFGNSTGSINYPFLTATLLGMHSEDATLPIGNKVMFYTTKKPNINDTIHVQTTVTSLESLQLVHEYKLNQNYPNPFNPTTTIEYSIPSKSDVSIKIFDILGRLVSSLVDEVRHSGLHRITFNAGNLASGMYIYQIHAVGDNGRVFDKCEKMMFIK